MKAASSGALIPVENVWRNMQMCEPLCQQAVCPGTEGAERQRAVSEQGKLQQVKRA